MESPSAEQEVRNQLYDELIANTYIARGIANWSGREDLREFWSLVTDWLESRKEEENGDGD